LFIDNEKPYSTQSGPPPIDDLRVDAKAEADSHVVKILPAAGNMLADSEVREWSE
jgi:hypothetical protein